MNLYIISTERLGLRRWIPADTEPLSAMNKDEEVMKYFPSTLSDAQTLAMIERINVHFEKNGFGLFAVEHKATKQFIGFTGFAIPSFTSFFTPCIEIGWRYKREVWGQGFATEAAGACLQYGFSTLQFNEVLSFTSCINKNSEKLMQRIGMQYITEFDHPAIEKINPLCRHFLYKINKPVG